MSMLTINRELPAMRCEICHQTDCFTPETGECTRCAGLTVFSSEPSPLPVRAVAAAAGFLADYRARTAHAGGWKDGLFITPHIIFGFGLVHTFMYESDALFALTPIAFFVSFICFFSGICFFVEARRTGADSVRGFRWTFIGGGFFLAFLLMIVLGLILAVIYSIFPPLMPLSGQTDDF